jgi:hypothetical protein
VLFEPQAVLLRLSNEQRPQLAVACHGLCSPPGSVGSMSLVWQLRGIFAAHSR